MISFSQHKKEWNRKWKDLLGKCPAYHDPITHQNSPSSWKEKMLNVKEVESYISTRERALLEEIMKMCEEMKINRI